MEQTLSILDTINSPDDVKKLSVEEMNLLSKDIRKGILNRVNTVGGHLGPDLGIVEATIALHYVFSTPKDKFVFDVSHQCYPHKMLTGRKDAFLDPIANPEISGYFNDNESSHDTFMIGHTSTSISLACGLAKARDIKKETGNIIALIGDGSLSGGEAYEGLNNGAELGTNFIVIVNDNEMSIAENHGGLYKNLEELRNTNGQSQNNFFKTLGYEYFYLEEGNDIQKLIEIFNKVKDINHPVVVHIHTLKGKGYEPAQTNKEQYHWQLPNFLNKNQNSGNVETYDSITKDYLLNKIQEGEPIVVSNAGTPGVFAFDKEYRNKLGKNYVDVGIAEEHLVAFNSGLAKANAKPVMTIMSSFIQRTYDQLSQDLALNNSSATILVYWGGISSADATHLGLFDIPLVSNIPNIIYLAPTNKEEYLKMLDWSINQNSHPVAIRVPFGVTKSMGRDDNTDYSNLNKFKMIEKGNSVAIVALGSFFEMGEKLKSELKEKMNIEETLINPCYITGVDSDMLEDLKLNHKVVVTLEDGALDGGFGEKISRFYSNSSMKVLNYGARKHFYDRTPIDIIYDENRLRNDLIIEDIKKII